MYWIWKIYITKQFCEIIYTKFRINFAKCIGIWKILHNETISRNNLYEILQNFATFRKILRNKVQQNFAKIKLLSSLFRISRNKKILFHDHTTRPPILQFSFIHKNFYSFTPKSQDNLGPG
jgi:hypothetical protein